MVMVTQRSIREYAAADSTIMTIMWWNNLLEGDPLNREAVWILYPMMNVADTVVARDTKTRAHEIALTTLTI